MLARTIEFLERSRDHVRRFWVGARFNVSLEGSISRPFCNYDLGIVLLD